MAQTTFHLDVCVWVLCWLHFMLMCLDNMILVGMICVIFLLFKCHVDVRFMNFQPIILTGNENNTKNRIVCTLE